ncbi:hypothetical protein Terro_2970 [Terriglobus roseus DSM 18391]|uniref:Uncharacterized protein n=1 Tax=Terriglobus roseus (strain DSM 18391 / NRRL B-41598 / KBS 63) TaxID=926566 RepID=I3ZIY4_TERRK|nr:hypothetical protein Terro_2970 [Terriglobus roseus DSM 18391]
MSRTASSERKTPSRRFRDACELKVNGFAHLSVTSNNVMQLTRTYTSPALTGKMLNKWFLNEIDPK